MELVQPQVFHVGQTTCDTEGIKAYLAAIGAEKFSETFMPLFSDTSKPSDVEMLIEIMGRGCYRSFEPGMNPNVTKIREGNGPYIANILNSKHGSVIEHAVDNYIFLNVSRVFTHELVRHRIGTAFSQESLRYVRLDQLKCWYPGVFANLTEISDKIPTQPANFYTLEDQKLLQKVWEEAFTYLEHVQLRMANILKLDQLTSFKLKKMLTSAMRRLAPDGLATMIGFSANHRAMRWEIELRTNEGAEEEIRLAFGMVFDEQLKRYPALYQDADVDVIDGLRQIKFKNYKI